MVPGPASGSLVWPLWLLCRGSEREGGVHGSQELKQTFHESRIQRLILFVAHIVLQNGGVDYFELCIRMK